LGLTFDGTKENLIKRVGAEGTGSWGDDSRNSETFFGHKKDNGGGKIQRSEGLKKKSMLTKINSQTQNEGVRARGGKKSKD